MDWIDVTGFGSQHEVQYSPSLDCCRQRPAHRTSVDGLGKVEACDREGEWQGGLPPAWMDWGHLPPSHPDQSP